MVVKIVVRLLVAGTLIMYVLLFLEAGTSNQLVRHHVFFQVLSQSPAMLDARKPYTESHGACPLIGSLYLKWVPIKDRR